jgi:hypothetical protein
MVILAAFLNFLMAAWVEMMLGILFEMAIVAYLILAFTKKRK